MVAKDHAEFKTNKMQDALEYLEHILSFINVHNIYCKNIFDNFLLHHKKYAFFFTP